MMDIKRLRRNARHTLLIADREDWSDKDISRILAKDALVAADVFDGLLSICEKIATWTGTDVNEEEGTFAWFAEELVPELFAAIAASKGE